MLIAQISDLHVRPKGRNAYECVPTNEMLRAAVARLAALDPAPDVVLASGDLTDCGLAEEYGQLRAILQPLRMPVLFVPGNHDRRELLRDTFADHAHLQGDDEFLHYAVDDFPVKFVGLDTVVPGQTYGELCDRRLAWLDARLAERRGSPVVIFMHHPPFSTGVGALDGIGCRNGDRLAAILHRHDNVERVLAGHHHRPIQCRFAGTIGMVAPSTAHQVALDMRDGESMRFIMEPPAFLLHRYCPDTGIATHHAYVEPFDGPFEFALDRDYPGGQLHAAVAYR